jgi:folylpolyglutamate synthase/dihydropteroate synthase
MLALLAPHARTLIITQGCYNAQDPVALAAIARTLHGDVRTEPNAARAVEMGLALAGSGGSMLVAGSLYLVPEALRILDERLPTLSRTHAA